jgi:hypothetical protein
LNDNTDSRTIRKNIPLSFAELTVTMRRVGDDILLLVEGGDRPHIGCTVLAVPRESLHRDGGRSSTSSVINRTGHRDEEICRCLAEKCAAEYGAVTVCTGGFHVDNITPEEIEEVLYAVREAKL